MLLTRNHHLTSMIKASSNHTALLHAKCQLKNLPSPASLKVRCNINQKIVHIKFISDEACKHIKPRKQ